MIYQLNYGIEYIAIGLEKVMWYQQKVSTQIARVPRTYTWHVAENKEVTSGNYRTLPCCCGGTA
jgi:hypothetical protein